MKKITLTDKSTGEARTALVEKAAEWILTVLKESQNPESKTGRWWGKKKTDQVAVIKEDKQNFPYPNDVIDDALTLLQERGDVTLS